MNIDIGPGIVALVGGLLVPLEILVVDLLLSTDNALVVAMACRGLPDRDVRIVVLIGTAGAIGLRLAMALVVTALLQTPFLKIVASLALLVIAVRLTLAQGDANTRAAIAGFSDGTRTSAHLPAPLPLYRPIVAIVAADAIMSLDNVVAVAAIAGGSMLLLSLGLALSVPMLIWGSTLIRRFFEENRLIVLASGVFLGWLAGQIGVTDPLLAHWIPENAPALALTVPLAGAAFVLWQNLILSPERALS